VDEPVRGLGRGARSPRGATQRSVRAFRALCTRRICQCGHPTAAPCATRSARHATPRAASGSCRGTRRTSVRPRSRETRGARAGPPSRRSVAWYTIRPSIRSRAKAARSGSAFANSAQVATTDVAYRRPPGDQPAVRVRERDGSQRDHEDTQWHKLELVTRVPDRLWRSGARTGKDSPPKRYPEAAAALFQISLPQGTITRPSVGPGGQRGEKKGGNHAPSDRAWPIGGMILRRPHREGSLEA
jgi:hypothetical protein